MLESVSGFLAALKAATPQILLGIALASAVLVFGPRAIVDPLGLQPFLDANRSLVGTALLGSGCILLAQGLWWGGKHLGAPVRLLLKNRQRAELLRELTPDEKAYLVRYIADQKNTQYFRIDDGVAQGLAAKGVIFQSAAVGYIHDGWAFNLSTWARRSLNQDQSLLVGAGELPEELAGGATDW